MAEPNKVVGSTGGSAVAGGPAVAVPKPAGPPTPAGQAQAEKAKAVGATMPALPPLPKMAKKSKNPQPCGCGCGNATGSIFVPGHDGRLRGWTLRIERKLIKLEDVPAGERVAVEAYMKAGGTGSPKGSKEANIIAAKVVRERATKKA